MGLFRMFFAKRLWIFFCFFDPTTRSEGQSSPTSSLSLSLCVRQGPRGLDKLVHDDKGVTTISNDGATIMKVRDGRGETKNNTRVK